MKKNWGLVFLLVIVAACTSPTSNPPSPSTPMVTQSGTHIFTSTPNQPTKNFTRTPRPSATPTLSPSATPTFDIASVVTRTPAHPQDCPAPADVPLPDLTIAKDDFFPIFKSRKEAVLDYLNQGGDPQKLMAEYQRTWKGVEVFGTNEAIQDLTGDRVPEILIIPSADLYIFGCRDGRYQLLMNKFSDSVTMNPYLFQLAGIQDMNLDGMPEIVIAEYGGGGMSAGQGLDVYIYEWNEDQFVSLIPEKDYTESVSMYGGGDEYLPSVKVQDTDQNGTLELSLSGGIPSDWYDDYFSQAPWRIQSDAYHWNGQHFVPLMTEFSSPEYRYQAVQDGDRALLRYDYDKALAFYQEAIFNEKLLGWSPAHKERSIALHELTWNFDLSGTPTPIIPPNDPQEYPNLAAYARFRIMVLHLLAGHLPEAQTVYETLQEKFPRHEFTFIAQAFWNEYQRSKNLEEACTEAILVAEKHKDVLKFLGSDYHNSTQDILYEPKDICPFK